MSIYKLWYYNIYTIKELVNKYGVRKTFNSLRYYMKRDLVRLKHNRIQIRDRGFYKWIYES